MIVAAALAMAALSRADAVSGATRVAVAVAIVGAVAYAGLRIARRSPGRRGGAVVLACLAVGGGLTAMASTAPAECGTPPDGGLTHGRLALWSDAASTFGERPLLGAGAGAFLVASAEKQGESPVRFAHNLPLEVGAELGMAGLAALALLAVGVGRALRHARGTPSLWLFGPAVVAFLLANLVDWSWQITGVAAIFAVALGGVIAAGARS
jgi:O-antigen ligase